MKQDEGRGAIGRGTFGACFLATFRGIPVVVKELQPRSNTSAEKLRKEAAYVSPCDSKIGRPSRHPSSIQCYAAATKCQNCSAVSWG